MAQSKKKSPTGLLSEAAKKAGRGVSDAAKKVVGKQPATRSKSPGGNLSEAAKKAGRGIAEAVGMKTSRGSKSGSK